MGTATKYLLKYGYTEKNNWKYFSYYDTLFLNINGEKYEAIVLDSCGACMRNNIIDLFVSGPTSIITTRITIE